MKLYKVTNGYLGFGEVKVFVVAKDEKIATKLARQKFKEEVEKFHVSNNKSYYSDLCVECVCDDLTKEWASEVQDW